MATDQQQAPAGADAPAAAPAASFDAAVPADVPVLDEPSALEQVGGDLEFLHELLGDLWTESLAHMATVDGLAGQYEPKKLKDAAHGIKGAAANLHVRRVREAAANLERVGIDGIAGTLQSGPFEEKMAAYAAQLHVEMAGLREMMVGRGLPV